MLRSPPLFFHPVADGRFQRSVDRIPSRYGCISDAVQNQGESIAEPINIPR